MTGFEEEGRVAHIPGSKQVFGVHPTKASEMELTHRRYEALKRYAHGVNCVCPGLSSGERD